MQCLSPPQLHVAVVQVSVMWLVVNAMGLEVVGGV